MHELSPSQTNKLGQRFEPACEMMFFFVAWRTCSNSLKILSFCLPKRADLFIYLYVVRNVF